jgi:hypothetical protein
VRAKLLTRHWVPHHPCAAPAPAQAMSPVQVGTAFVGAGWLAAFGVAGFFIALRQKSTSATPVRTLSEK